MRSHAAKKQPHSGRDRSRYANKRSRSGTMRSIDHNRRSCSAKKRSRSGNMRSIAGRVRSWFGNKRWGSAKVRSLCGERRWRGKGDRGLGAAGFTDQFEDRMGIGTAGAQPVPQRPSFAPACHPPPGGLGPARLCLAPPMAPAVPTRPGATLDPESPGAHYPMHAPGQWRPGTDHRLPAPASPLPHRPMARPAHRARARRVPRAVGGSGGGVRGAR